jgi:hypothetical protein
MSRKAILLHGYARVLAQNDADDCGSEIRVRRVPTKEAHRQLTSWQTRNRNQ